VASSWFCILQLS